jgi:thiol-disulfide isomerase/thioredoxin
MKYIFVLLSALWLAPVAAHSIEYQWQNEKGEQVALESLKGKPVILHFWASWCPPCRTEMPAMSKWVKAHPDVQVVMISLDSSQTYAQEFYDDKHIQTPLNMGDMAATSRLGVRALPTTVIIDAKGEVSKRHLGDIDWGNAQVSQQVLSWL